VGVSLPWSSGVRATEIPDSLGNSGLLSNTRTSPFITKPLTLRGLRGLPGVSRGSVASGQHLIRRYGQAGEVGGDDRHVARESGFLIG
jgi:hypothetical protein